MCCGVSVAPAHASHASGAAAAHVGMCVMYSEFRNKRWGGATPADNPKSTPVADDHRAPKALQPPSRCADEAKLTPVGGVPPHAY